MRMNNLKGVVLLRNLTNLSLLLKSLIPLTVLKAARGRGASCYLIKIMVRKLRNLAIALFIAVLFNPCLQKLMCTLF